MDGFSRKFDLLVETILGDPDELGAYEPDEVRDMLQRLQDVEEDLEEIGQKVAIVSRDGGADTPDARAQRLRQVLYNNAKGNHGVARLTRDEANGALGGGYHKGSVLDAMKRAADGREADIDGASRLNPLDGVTFTTGSGKGSPSRVEIDLTDLTGAEIRQNLTTEIEGKGV
ncbi:hypothetical protein [Natronorarus salvus]|uniref:hypothetical protein n=1 Tax=Natronorarus salvus TaxID=3117733 RepID=UPI002F26872C